MKKIMSIIKSTNNFYTSSTKFQKPKKIKIIKTHILFHNKKPSYIFITTSKTSKNGSIPEFGDLNEPNLLNCPQNKHDNKPNTQLIP
jgi:predicted HTH transcriptional regulator